MNQAVGADMTAIEQARNDLAQRLVVLGDRARHQSRNILAEEIEAIRRVAAANGMFPAASVAHALEMALGRGERGPLIEGWIAVLRDAVLSDRQDREAGDIFAAACSIRLVG